MGVPDIDYDFDYIPWEQLAPYNLVGGEGCIYNLCSSQCTGDFHYPTTLPASPPVSSPAARAAAASAMELASLLPTEWATLRDGYDDGDEVTIGFHAFKIKESQCRHQC